MHRRPSNFLAAVILPLSLLVALVVAVGAPSTAGAQSRTANQPVVFVHGYTGSGANWNTAVGNFRSSGYANNELFVFEYNWRQSNATTASQLNTFINQVRNQTGWSRVDVVSHSMGSLSSRHCIKSTGCASKVDSWVSLGGPNHGTWLANACAWLHRSCAEMRSSSSFLANLNRGDETPSGAARYTTIRTPCDSLVQPSSSTELDGATNRRTSCFVSHSGLITNSGTLGWVKAAL